MIIVANKRTGATGEYIGRGSPLGNPFKIGPDGTRDEVVEKCHVWLDDQIRKGDKKILAELDRLYEIWKREGRLTLVCWCAPERCHGEIIKGILEDRASDDWERENL